MSTETPVSTVSPLEPVSLVGDLVRLDPLTAADAEGLAAASADGELWKLGYTAVPHPDDMAAHVAWRLGEHAAGRMNPFTARRVSDGTVIGATSFCNVDATTPRVEIGHTFNARSTQRTGTNTESKLLLLDHAFASVGCIAVEFRTHWLNRQSRAAIERLGARCDGVLRHHQRMADGTLRDTVVYSIVAPEWPAVRAELVRRLARG